MQSVSDIWSMILTRLREDLSETTIKTWFDETAVVALEGNNLYLHCPNTFKRTNIQDRFLPNIEAGLKDIFSADIAVHLLDDNGLQRFQSKEEEKPVSLMESGEFTFDTFVVGPSNRLACSAARAVADAVKACAAGKGKALQPPLHLRRLGAGQDPPALRHCPRHPGQIPFRKNPLYQGRRVYQRLH